MYKKWHNWMFLSALKFETNTVAPYVDSSANKQVDSCTRQSGEIVCNKKMITWAANRFKYGYDFLEWNFLSIWFWLFF